jgi:hypothetical protein
MTDHLELADAPVGKSNRVNLEVEYTPGVYRRVETRELSVTVAPV